MRVCEARRTLLTSALLLASCAGEAPDADPVEGVVAVTPAAQLPRAVDLPDTMLFRLESGAEVWWTIARESADSTGATCVERGLEVRRDETRVAVPLLYSADVPEIVDDTTIQVPLWTGCAAGRVYRVNVRTGQPVPLPIDEAGP
jgi:hypothetical protein